MLKSNASYGFFAAAAVWLLLAAYVGSVYVLWPVLTCAVGGLLLRLRPSDRLTWAWATSSAFLGLVLSAYKAYSSAQGVFGAFSTVSVISIAAFGVFALLHVALIYAGTSSPKQTT